MTYQEGYLIFPGVSGAHCEEESYGFPELSFMEFPSLDPRNNIISLELATIRQDSLLLYNPGGPHSFEFLALEVVGGKARLSFDLGSGPAVVGTAKMVADGSFHSIVARRTGKVSRGRPISPPAVAVPVGGPALMRRAAIWRHTLCPSTEPVCLRVWQAASLQVDSCSADEPHGFCFSRGEGAGSERYSSATLMRHFFCFLISSAVTVSR